MDFAKINASIMDLVPYPYKFDIIKTINKVYKNTNKDKKCCFCLNKIKLDEDIIKCNICKNIFHSNNSKNCEGLLIYLANYNKCPYCRNVI